MPRGREDEEEESQVEKADVHETDDDVSEKEVSTEPEEKDEDESSDPNDDAQAASRKERRANRYREQKELAAQANQRLQETERALNEERARRAALEETSRVIQYQANLQAQGQQKDPWEDAFGDLDKRFKAVAAEVSNLKGQNLYDQAAAERLQGEWNQLTRKQQEYVVQRENQRRDWYAQQQAPAVAAQQEQRAREAAAAARLQQDHPDVMSHPQAFQWAFFEFQKRITTEGKPNTFETANACMNEAAQRFKLRAAPRPDESQRRRYAGVSSGGGGGSERGGTIKMDKTFMGMAEARYPKLAKQNPALAHKKWAETIGKKILDEAD